jgi:protein gp37
MNETTIEWTDATWNPMSGCEVISEGCKYCYAKTLADNKRGTAAFPNGFDLTIRPHKLSEPERLKLPSRIFVNSMSDLFWEKVPDDYRLRIIDVISRTPQHQYQVLTKRPEKMLEVNRKLGGFPDNFWAGVSVENARNLWRMDILRQVNASIRFISAEPLIGPLDGLDLTGIHWVITGGESGLHLTDEHVRARRSLTEPVNGKWTPMVDRVQWIRDIRDACEASSVSFIHKQWGGLRPKSGGRELDGVIHDGYPRPAGYASPSPAGAMMAAW